MIRRLCLVVVLAGATGCVPRLSPLVGEAVPADRLPHPGLPRGYRKLGFEWELDDREMVGRGDGVARIASPDSARLDFFLAGGFGGGAAVLIGDSLRSPAPDFVRRLVPPPTLLWAALGRVAFPNLPDTVIRIEAGVLRADIGRPVTWRLSFRGDSLVRAERVDGGRVAEWVERASGSPLRIRYRDERARRSLQLTITLTAEVPEFDASIWRFDR